MQFPNISFHEKPYSGSCANICGQTHGPDEGNRRSSPSRQKGLGRNSSICALLARPWFGK